MISIVDSSNEYSELVSFSLNRNVPFHRWYSFVEGYSKEFVRRLIGEQVNMPKVCLDPFGGIGTTALTCQELGVKCYSTEVNPFFHEVATSKLKKNYSSKVFESLIYEVERYLGSPNLDNEFPKLESQTFFESEDKEKWIFNLDVAEGITDILSWIERLNEEKPKYAPLFKIALASILLKVSNVFRNGKCLSYKKNWQDNFISRETVCEMFLHHCKKIILVDIKSNVNIKSKILNEKNFLLGDVREKLESIPNNSVDLVITSPPYLNSRDYTDVYRLELWILGYIKTFERETFQRKQALTSHVQVKLPDVSFPKIKSLEQFINILENSPKPLWNKNIPNMVKGYFNDMDHVIDVLNKKVKKGGKVYINVSNSAYVGVICEVDKILAEIGQLRGFKVDEIRIARYITSSTQQKLPERLRESIIVLEKV